MIFYISSTKYPTFKLDFYWLNDQLVNYCSKEGYFLDISDKPNVTAYWLIANSHNFLELTLAADCISFELNSYSTYFLPKMALFIWGCYPKIDNIYLLSEDLERVMALQADTNFRQIQEFISHTSS